MNGNLGATIRQYRQFREMTQEEFALRLGVTPQAVSKWERGNGLPDVSLLGGICSILHINANTLLGITGDFNETGDMQAEAGIKSSMIAEPLLIEFGEGVIPAVFEGLETSYVYDRRKELADQEGILLPLIHFHFRDSLKLPGQAYRILSYQKVLFEGSVDPEDKGAYQRLVDQAVEYCRDNYAEVLNKQLVKVMVDNVKEQYPGVADGLIPEQISYLAVERKLQEKLKQGESIKDLIHLIEEMEDGLGEGA